jgi:hypothetical protein
MAFANATQRACQGFALASPLFDLPFSQRRFNQNGIKGKIRFAKFQTHDQRPEFP